MENRNRLEDVDKTGLFVILFLLFILVILVIGVSYQVFSYAGNNNGSKNGSGIFGQIIGSDGTSGDTTTTTNGGTTTITQSFYDNSNIFTDGTVTLVFVEGINSINITNAMPIADEQGKKMLKPNEYMDFVVSVDIRRKSKVDFQVAAIKDNTSTLPNNAVKLYLQKGVNSIVNHEDAMAPTKYTPLSKSNEFNTPAGAMVMDEESTTQTTIYNYRLKMWVANDYEVENTKKYFTVKVGVFAKGDRTK